jgi:hypothetical protein
LQSVIFESPSLLTTIESVSFQNCSDLTSIDIPASVTAIGTEAFKNSGLTTVTVNWTAGAIPTINANVFDGLDLSHMTLNVPTGTEDDYKAVSVWQDFGAIQFVATLTLSQAALSFTTAAGSETVNVTSNITWTAVSSDVSWLNVTPPASGTGNGSFMLTVTAHTGSSARTGTVTVSDGGSLAQAVTVTQAGVSAPPPPSPPSPPVLHRHVTLRIEGSVVSQPAPGIYDIISGENFIFTLTPPSGKVPVVQTGRTVDGGPETLTGTPNADGSYTFVVQQIREDLTLAVTFVTGTADVPAPQVWLSGRVLHVRTAPAGPLALYAVSGALVLRLDKPSGDAEFDLSALPRGLYILRAATGRTVKIQIQ